MAAAELSVPTLRAALPSTPGWIAHARRAIAWLTLRHLSLIAVLAWTAHAHWSLAILLGAPIWLAAALPVAVDAYVLSSLRAWETAPDRRHRDLIWALALDGAAVSGAHAASQVAVPPIWRAVIAAVLGVVLVLVLWRVHALDVEVRRAVRHQRQRQAPTASAAPTPQVAPVVAPPSVVRQVAAPRRANANDGHRAMAQQLRDDGADASAAKARLMADGAAESTARRIIRETWTGHAVAS